MPPGTSGGRACRIRIDAAWRSPSGSPPTVRGDVTVVSVGGAGAVSALRHALAVGAGRAVRIDAAAELTSAAVAAHRAGGGRRGVGAVR